MKEITDALKQNSLDCNESKLSLQALRRHSYRIIRPRYTKGICNKTKRPFVHKCNISKGKCCLFAEAWKYSGNNCHASRNRSSRVLLKQPTMRQVAKELLLLNGTRNFFIIITRNWHLHCILSRMNAVYIIIHDCLRCILILLSHLRLGVSSILFRFFRSTIHMHFSYPQYVQRVPPISSLWLAILCTVESIT
jgi:hypothetical protein